MTEGLFVIGVIVFFLGTGIMIAAYITNSQKRKIKDRMRYYGRRRSRK